MEEWFHTWNGPVGFEIKDLRITAGEDVAFCYSFIRISGKKTDGKKPSVWLRATISRHGHLEGRD